MKCIKLILLIVSVIIYISSFQFSKEKKITDPYYNSLLSIESAKKLYKKQHYEESLSKLLKVVSLIQSDTIKSEAIIEIAYVKFLMGYSLQTYKIFIKKALDLNSALEISLNHKKSFSKAFKLLKESYSPVKTKKLTFIQSITKKPKPQSIGDMTIRDNLIFKMKKELSSLRETNNHQKETNNKQSKEISRQKKTNSKNFSNIVKLRNKISTLQKRKDKDYKRQYNIIKKENMKLENNIKDKDKTIIQLTSDIKEQEAKIKQLEKIKTVKTKTNRTNTLGENLKKSNAFKTLHKIWNKKFL